MDIVQWLFLLRKKGYFMNWHFKRHFLALLLVILMLFSCMPTVYAQENGLLLPQAISGENQQDTTEKPEYDILLNGEESTSNNLPDSTQDNTYDEIKPEEKPPEEDQGYDILLEGEPIQENQILLENPKQPETAPSSELTANYEDVYGLYRSNETMLFSASGSDPYSYVTGNGGLVTIAADRPLNNILHYDGKIVDNIHIAKWIKGDPAALEFPAYCKNPGWKGVAQHTDKQYQIKPFGSIGAEESKILGVVRAGYPFKTPQELGVDSVDDAYYATNGAIHTAIVNGSLDNWSIKSGNEERNTKILNALKQIYNDGVAHPYSPPPITVKLTPTTGSEEATEDGDWITNTYEFQTDYPINSWKFHFLSSSNYNAMVESGEIEVYVGGTKVGLQKNINVVWDEIDGFLVQPGESVTVKFKKSTAGATGINLEVYGVISNVDFKNCLTYLGDTTLSGNWQGYCYNTTPYAMDKANFIFDKGNIPTPPPDDQKTGNGSLIVQKLDWKTKENAADAVFHIQGLSESCKWINIAVRASKGAVLPELGGGATISVSDGIITLSNIPGGFYEITEISAPPNYDVAVGQNSQTVEVKNADDDTPGAVQVTFENKPFGSLTITKVDADTGEKLSSVYFKVVNNVAGLEQTVQTGADGTVTIENLPQGNYEITEIATRDDYILNETPETVGVQWGEETTVTIKNKAKPSIEILKIDSETTKPIAGVAFQITHKDTNQTYNATTDGQGKINISGVDEGWLDVLEVTPAPGYIANNEVYQVYAESGKPGKITIKNTKRSAIVIEKTDINGKPLEGVSFNIYNFGGVTPIPNSPVKTNAQGIATLENLNPGHYQVQEVAPPTGYLLDTKKYDLIVQEGETQTIRLKIVNKRLPDLIVKKVDKAHNDKGLAGAVFEVKETDGQALPGSPYTTGADGTFTIKSIDLGITGIKKLTITEIQPPPNYDLSSPAIQYVTMEPDKDVTLTFSNAELPTLIVHKVDSITKDVLPGAEFLVTKAKNGSLNGGVVEVGKFYSDANGQFKLEHVEPGWYRILETHPASGYREETNYYQDVFLQAGEDKEITFENTPKNAIIIRKVDSDSGEALPNIRFEVRYLSGATGTSGTVIGIYTTSKNGTAVVAGLKPGVYSVAELKADSDHILDDTIQTVTLTDDNAVVTVEFGNAPKGGLLIKKMDAVTKEPLSNVVFKITDIKGNVIGENNGEFRTDETGTIYIPQLVGGYIVQEIKTKDGYILDDTPKTIYVGTGKVYSLEFFNQPLNSFTVQKLDGATKKPLAGATIKIMTAEGALIKEAVTDESGFIIVDDLKPGTYLIQEITAPPGYNLDNTVKTIVLKQNQAQKFELYNYEKSAIQILKKDSVTKEPLQGAKFKVSRSDGKIIGEYTTDASGTAVVLNLSEGSYTIQEVQAPDGYILNTEPQNIEVKENKTYNLEFFNQPLNGFTVQKLDGATKKPLAGATIKIMTAEGTLIKETVTDEGGFINVTGLKPGIYQVQEIAAPQGYNLDNTVKTVILKQNESPKIELYNYTKSTLLLLKKDAVSKEPLIDAVFKVSQSDGRIIGQYKTDATGVATVPNLDAGSYVVQEVKSPDGYILNSEPQNITIKENAVYKLEFYNQPTNSFVIIKMDGDTKEPLADAKIRVSTVDNTLIGEYRTNATGTITINGLLPGNYKVQEIQAPEGYLLDDTEQLVKLEQNKPQKIELFNYKKPNLIIQKEDKQTHKALKGARFQVEKMNGERIGEFTTGENGKVVIPNLTPGWYVVTEISAPEGYELDNNASKNVQVKSADPVTVKFENNKVPSLKIIKKDKISGKTLTGVEFHITRNSKDYGTFKTDKSGEILIENKLPAGNYIIEETKTLKGYALDKTVQKVSLSWGDEKTIEWFNYPYGSIQLQKVDTSNNKGISGVEFEFFDKDKKSIGKYKTDSKGYIRLEKMFSEGVFYVRETEPLEGYLSDDSTIKVNIKWGKTTRIEVENKPIEGKLKIIKTAEDNNSITGVLKGEPIENAEFTIYDSEGKEVETITTDKNGEALSSFIPYGDYTVKETEAAPYYVLDSTPIKFSIVNEKEVIEKKVTNKSAALQVHVEKSGYQTVNAGEMVRYELYNIQNCSAVGLSEFTLTDYIPADKITPTRLFTGSYNQNLSYRILYRTNKNNEYKVLRDNLFTDKVYEIDLKPSMQYGEAISEIKFEFKNVGVGFREVERPLIYCQTKDSLQNNSQFMNTVEVSGRYDMQVVKDKDTFITNVLAPEPEKKGKLPKTGY